MCKFRPGSGNLLHLPGKAKEKQCKTKETIQEMQGLNFLYSMFYIFCYYTTPTYNPMNGLIKLYKKSTS